MSNLAAHPTVKPVATHARLRCSFENKPPSLLPRRGRVQCASLWPLVAFRSYFSPVSSIQMYVKFKSCAGLGVTLALRLAVWRAAIDEKLPI